MQPRQRIKDEKPSEPKTEEKVAGTEEKEVKKSKTDGKDEKAKSEENTQNTATVPNDQNKGVGTTEIVKVEKPCKKNAKMETVAKEGEGGNEREIMIEPEKTTKDKKDKKEKKARKSNRRREKSKMTRPVWRKKRQRSLLWFLLRVEQKLKHETRKRRKERRINPKRMRRLRWRQRRVGKVLTKMGTQKNQRHPRRRKSQREKPDVTAVSTTASSEGDQPKKRSKVEATQNEKRPKDSVSSGLTLKERNSDMVRDLKVRRVK